MTHFLPHNRLYILLLLFCFCSFLKSDNYIFDPQNEKIYYNSSKDSISYIDLGGFDKCKVSRLTINGNHIDFDKQSLLALNKNGDKSAIFTEININGKMRQYVDIFTDHFNYRNEKPFLVGPNEKIHKIIYNEFPIISTKRKNGKTSLYAWYVDYDKRVKSLDHFPEFQNISDIWSISENSMIVADSSRLIKLTNLGISSSPTKDTIEIADNNDIISNVATSRDGRYILYSIGGDLKIFDSKKNKDLEIDSFYENRIKGAIKDIRTSEFGKNNERFLVQDSTDHILIINKGNWSKKSWIAKIFNSTPPPPVESISPKDVCKCSNEEFLFFEQYGQYGKKVSLIISDNKNKIINYEFNKEQLPCTVK